MSERLIQEQLYTYEQWLNLDIDGRSELIDGHIYMMADPTGRHQEVLSELNGQIWTFLRDKPCQVFFAPFSVRLFKYKNTAYEPDLVVICDPSIRRQRGCVGAPDMIVEVLSRSTAKMDKVKKYNDYLQAGIKEYWIVDPDKDFIDAYRLMDGRYVLRTYYKDDIAPVQVLPGCEIDLSLVFQDIFEDPDK